MKTNKILNLSLIVVLFCFGCNFKKDPKHEEAFETYNILSTLNNYITTTKMVFFALPAPPPAKGINLDSVIDSNRKKDTIKLINALIKKNGKLIVTIDSELTPPILSEIKKEKIQRCLKLNFEETYNSFGSLKKKSNIDVSQIKMNDYSIIIPYKDYYEKKKIKGYGKLNISLNFSKIAFNKNHTKAIVIMGARFGKLNSFSAIYFLEKEKEKWVIRCENGLTIS